jgi:hypothetical protein
MNSMRLMSIARLCVLVLPLALCAQEALPVGAPPFTVTSASPESPDAPVLPASPSIETGTRIFGVLPNYKTVDKMTASYEPISTRTKFMIASKDSFDWPEFFVAGAMSGLNQMTEQNPEWGQGVKGYAKRYGASLADQTISNYLTEAILPSVLHHDPRYFRLGQGSPVRRIVHAVSWVVISKTDTNHNTLNVSELLGSGASATIGMLYYPSQERNAGAVTDRFITQVSFDAASSVLKEYWPDIRRLLERKRH